jgi:plastocyanin
MSKVIACAAVSLCLLALGATGAVLPDETTVRITDTGFVPDRIEVTVGQRVVWENTTQRDQTVTARSSAPGAPYLGQEEKEKPLFDSGTLKPGFKWWQFFAKEGTYEYMSRMDKSMTGTIVVKPIK